MGRWLVTGCSTGIGREIARAALEAGHSVVVTARRTETVADFADDFGERAVVVALDVTDKDQIASAVQAADDAFGGIDVLVNNAGNGYLSAIEEGEDDEGSQTVRHQLLRRRRHDQGGPPPDASPAVRAHRQHLVDDRAGGQPAERLLLVDEVRARGADRGAGTRGATARHQGHRHRARRIPYRLGRPIDVGILHSDRRLQRERRCSQDDDQGVRQPPARAILARWPRPC